MRNVIHIPPSSESSPQAVAYNELKAMAAAWVEAAACGVPAQEAAIFLDQETQRLVAMAQALGSLTWNHCTD